jgi:hypothetical protein
MAILNFIFAYGLAYLVFMVLTYFLARVIFYRLDEQGQEAKKQKQLMLIKSKRVRVKRHERLAHA